MLASKIGVGGKNKELLVSQNDFQGKIFEKAQFSQINLSAIVPLLIKNKVLYDSEEFCGKM